MIYRCFNVIFVPALCFLLETGLGIGVPISVRQFPDEGNLSSTKVSFSLFELHLLLRGLISTKLCWNWSQIKVISNLCTAMEHYQTRQNNKRLEYIHDRPYQILGETIWMIWILVLFLPELYWALWSLYAVYLWAVICYYINVNQWGVISHPYLTPSALITRACPKPNGCWATHIDIRAWISN